MFHNQDIQTEVTNLKPHKLKENENNRKRHFYSCKRPGQG